MATRDWYEQFYSASSKFDAAWYRAIAGFLSRRRELSGPLLELGCGRGNLLDSLVATGRFSANEVFGLEQSGEAIAEITRWLTNVKQADIEAGLSFADGSVGIVVLAEVIEHLHDPDAVLKEVARVLKPGGLLILSFPNYVSLPWLLVRILAALLNRPNWIVLQPIDHIFFFPVLASRVRRAGFKHEESIGTVYGPPVLYRFESDQLSSVLTRLGLAALSFHPVLIFSRKV